MISASVDRTAIVIPAYNEAGNIERTVREIHLKVPDVDVVVINDGSTDATSALARAAGAIVLDLPYNLGIGGAVQTGYKFVAERGFGCVARLDGDGQHDPAQLAALIAPVATGEVDVATGSRFIAGRDGDPMECYRASFSRSIGIRVFAGLVSAITGRRVTDTTSGYQVCNADVVAYYARNFPTDYPEVEMIAELCRAGYRVGEVPVRMRRREEGRSSITPLRSAYFVLKVSLALLVGTLRPPSRRVRLISEGSAHSAPALQREYEAA